MTVKLEVGMTAVRRDGERVGPVRRESVGNYPFKANGRCYTENGNYWIGGLLDELDIIAAGHPWSELGAQVGDRVRRVWSEQSKSVDDWEFLPEQGFDGLPDSLYVIVKRAVVHVASEPEIEWGDWVGTDVPARDMGTCELRIVKGVIVAHRLPKPPVVQEYNARLWPTFDIYPVDIKLTKVDNVTTVEIVK